MLVRKFIFGLLVFALSGSLVFAQSQQLGSLQVLGNATGSQRPATATNFSAFVAQISQCVQANSIGFVGDGSTSNDAAFNAFWPSPVFVNTCLEFGVGKYAFSAAINKTMAAALQSVTIRGQGSDLTSLFWTAGGGMKITQGNPLNSVHIRDLSIITGSANTGSGLWLNSSQILASAVQSDVTNVQFRGNDWDDINANTTYWGIGLNILGWSNLLANNVNTYGKIIAAGGGIGVQVGGSGTIPTIVVSFENSNFFAHNIGVKLNSFWEGITFFNCNWQLQTGIAGLSVPAAQTHTGPGLNIISSQFDSAGNQIDLASSVPQLVMTGNTINTVGNSTFGLRQVGGSNSQITGNQFTSGGGTGGTAVFYSGTNGTIVGNGFVGMATGIDITGANNVTVNPNNYASVTTSVTNPGGTANTVINFGSGGTVLYNGGPLGTPSSGVATNLTGTAAGLTAGAASAVTITNDNASATQMFIPWVNGTSGNLSLNVSSAKLSFIPSTGSFSATSLTASTGVSGGNFNNVIITPPASTATLTLGSGKTFTTTNTLTLSGTDGTVQTFPTTSATIARTDAGQTFTGTNVFSSTITGSISGNAATVTTNANLTGDVTSVGNATTLTNAPVIAKVLTAFTSGAGTVTASDSILSAFQKINGNDALKLPLAGGTMTGAILFSADNTIDIGASGATRPRTGYFGTSIITVTDYGGTAAGSTKTVNGTSSGSPASAYLFLQSNGQLTNIGNAIAPDSLLTVNSNTVAGVAPSAGNNFHTVGADGTLANWQQDTFGAQGFIGSRYAGGTAASKTATPGGTTVFSFSGQGWDTSAYATMATIDFLTSANTWTTGNHGGAMRVRTVADGTTTIVESARFSASGGLAIGRTDEAGAGNLLLAGSIQLASIAACQTVTGANVSICTIRGSSGAGFCSIQVKTSTNIQVIAANVPGGC